MMHPHSTTPVDPTSAPPTSMPLDSADGWSMRACGATHRGHVREENQDHFTVATLGRALWDRQSSRAGAGDHCARPAGYLMVVADGIGGEPGGARASALAVETVESLALDALAPARSAPSTASDDGVSRELEAVLRRADRAVHAAAASERAHPHMGTTLTIAFALEHRLYVAHAGDTRCYLLRDGQLTRITTDHTLAQQLTDAGVLPEREARLRYGNALTNAIGGGGPLMFVELHQVDLVAGDVVMLCSDGLHGAVDDDDIARMLCREPDPDRACDALIRAANDLGGRDNVTVIVARYD